MRFSASFFLPINSSSFRLSNVIVGDSNLVKLPEVDIERDPLLHTFSISKLIRAAKTA